MSLALAVETVVTIVLSGGLVLGALAFVLSLPWRDDEVRDAELGIRQLRERAARGRRGRTDTLARVAVAA